MARQEIRKIAKAVREQLVRYGYGGGRCGDTSREVAKQLRAAGYAAKVIAGSFLIGRHASPHRWVMVDDLIIDITLDQFQIGFDDLLPEVLIAPIEEWPQYQI